MARELFEFFRLTTVRYFLIKEKQEIKIGEYQMNILKKVLLLSVTAGSLFAQGSAYQDYNTLKDRLEKITEAYPNIAQLENLGTTTGGRHVLVLKMGTGELENKPAVLLVAGVNATDLAGTDVLMRFIESSSAAYGTIDSITAMLDRTTFYIFPRVSPDATENLFLAPAYQRRLNRSSMDLDSDGQKDEDGFDDLNQDGYITTMRVSESAGTWIEDRDFPPLVKQADPENNEIGVYTLYSEGFDNDGDGNLNEDEPGGTDFNKNFTYQYNLFERGAGAYQISDIETREVVDFAFSHNNIALVFAFSDNDNLIRPWESSQKPNSGNTQDRQKKPYTEVANEDAPYFRSVSESFKSITGYSQTGLPASAHGAFNEWAYYHFGRWSFSTPAWVPPAVRSAAKDSVPIFNPGEKKENSKPAEKREYSYDQRLWAFLQVNGRQEAYVPWKEIEHPDFPGKKVEIGGFKPVVYTNPPVDSLEGIYQTYQPFLIKLADWLPRISIDELKTERLNESVYRLTFSVVNKGYLPSNPQAASANQWAPKVRVTVSLKEGQKLAGGKNLNFVNCLPGSGGNRLFSWVIIGQPGQTVRIEAGSPMTGTIKKSVTLQ